MKRIFFMFLVILILLASIFGGGVFLAKWKVSREAQSKPAERVSLETIENIPEIKKENREEQKEEALLPENKTEEKKFSFAILGDTQYFKAGVNGGYQMAANSIKKINPNLVFGIGDLVSSCDKTAECEKKLEDWKNVLGTLASKTYVVQGNHDRTGGEKADRAWEKVFDYLPTNGPEGFSRFAYSFDLENSHFVILASDKPKENDVNGTQLDWLEQDLAKNKQDLPAGRQGNIFVFFHEPAYPTNSKIGESLDENPENRNRLWDILNKYKTKAVFSGHEHIQSRRQVSGLYQFGFGNTDAFNHLPPKAGNAEYFYVGQGFGMVEVEGKKITVKTYSVQGQLLDSFTLLN